MRSLRQGIRVIYMSGYSEHAAGEAAKCDAAASVLTKPFSRAVLLRTVRDILPIPTA
jgi:CheY-like chemotaxis protein